jgi:ankyrin repeat protein
MNPKATVFVPSGLLVPSSVLLRQRHVGNNDGNKTKKKKKKKKKQHRSNKFDDKIKYNEYPQLSKKKTQKTTSVATKAIWPNVSSSNVARKNDELSCSNEAVKFSIKINKKKGIAKKVKRGKAKYYEIGEFKFQKPLFSSSSIMKRAEDSVIEADNDNFIGGNNSKNNNNVTVQNNEFLEPAFIKDIVEDNHIDYNKMYKFAIDFIRDDNVSKLAFLLEKHLDVINLDYIMDENNLTLLTFAITNNSYKSVSLLLKYGAGNDKAFGTNAKATELPLHVCCDTDNSIMLNEILKYKHVYINRKDCDGNTALHRAVVKDQYACVLALCNSNGARFLFNKKGYMPLHLASKNNAIQCFKILLNRSTTSILNRTNSRNETPLFVACKYNSVAAASMLLKEGANMHIFNNEFKTPLYIAIERGFKDIVELLLVRGVWKNRHLLRDSPAADRLSHMLPMRRNNLILSVSHMKQRLPLYIAARNGDFIILKLLLEHNFDVNKMDAMRCETALFAVVKYLLYKEDENHVNNVIECFELLMSYGADINLKCGVKSKITPLICSLLQGKIGIKFAARLVKCGADTNVEINHMNPIAYLIKLAVNTNTSAVQKETARRKKNILYGILFLLENGVQLPEMNNSVVRNEESVSLQIFKLCFDNNPIIDELFNQYSNGRNCNVGILSKDYEGNKSHTLEKCMFDLIHGENVDDNNFDVAFLIQNETYVYAHECILSSRLDYFKKYFHNNSNKIISNDNSGICINTANKCQIKIIYGFEWIRNETCLHYFLEFIYTFNITWGGNDVLQPIIDLIVLGEHTNFETLIDHAYERLMEMFAEAAKIDQQYAKSLHDSLMEYGEHSNYSRLITFLGQDSVKEKVFSTKKSTKKEINSNGNDGTNSSKAWVSKLDLVLSKLDGISKLRIHMHALYESINSKYVKKNHYLSSLDDPNNIITTDNEIITFTFDGDPKKMLHAHKLILSKRVVYFQKLFASGMRETYTNTIKFGGDLNENIIDYLLQFVYTDSLEPLIQIEHLCQLYKFAEQICYESLVGYLEKRLIKSCNMKTIFDIINVMPVISMSNTVGSYHVKFCVFSFVIENITEIKQISNDNYSGGIDFMMKILKAIGILI